MMDNYDINDETSDINDAHYDINDETYDMNNAHYDINDDTYEIYWCFFFCGEGHLFSDGPGPLVVARKVGFTRLHLGGREVPILSGFIIDWWWLWLFP